MRQVITILALVCGSLGHGDHGSSGPAKGESIAEYAQRHMSTEHHIDAFDTLSFFQLHDLNRDNVWDAEEIQAVYGVHHVYSQQKSKDEVEHQEKADRIVHAVLQSLDLNKDGLIQPEELEKVGLGGLPNFEDLGAEGHHYDVESEYFLHHEEKYHSTPETQTDESYTHPEDVLHFAEHENIERIEAEREAKFRGIPVEEVMKQQKEAVEAVITSTKPIVRVPPPEKQDPATRYKDAKSESVHKGEWGTGDAGYKAPVDASDKLRKNLPYKYKFRRSWGDF